ncbi:MAG: MASE3 domain-containing protein [bacterium]|nr:MASE3 domain-containing protein [bacterium]
MPNQSAIKITHSFIQLSVILALLLWSHQYSYPLFHSLAEIFCVIISASIFTIIWNSRKFIDNDYFLFVGVSLLFVGIIDLFHTLAYKGMGIFTFGGANLPTQLWLAGRYLEAAALVSAPFFINKKTRPNLLFSAYLALGSLLLASIFIFKIFPASYLDGVGLTTFKIISEYLVAALLIISIILLYKKRQSFEKRVWRLLILAIILKILSEIMFTLYVNVFSSANLLGHIFKVASFYLFYLGIIETALMRPYQLLFKNLKDSETSFKESEQRYRSLVEYSPNAIFLHLHGVITYINPVGVKLFDAQTADQLIGKKILDFVDEPYKNLVSARTEKIYQGAKTVPTAEIKIITLTGKKIEVEATGSLINLQGRLAGQSVMNNITARKEIDRAKTEFVSLASHQLRTPLASISLSTELLLRGVGGPLEENQIRYLQEISKASQRMKNLIEALLNITRIELGTFAVKWEMINLIEEVDKILKEEEIQIKLKQLNFIKIYAADLPLIRFDKNILGVIIDNLMANAIRYTPARGKITLQIKKGAAKIIISLSDTGCGIPKSQQDKIFAKLFRADNAKEISTEGAGLGLYMTRSILKKIGGEIWFSSEQNKGTTFFVTIPLDNRPGQTDSE